MTEEKRVPSKMPLDKVCGLLLAMLASVEVERDQLKTELAEMQWKPITPDSLPKDGDEISDGRFRVDDASSHIPDWGEEKMTDVDWHLHGWTLYRAINPPKP